MLKRVSGVKLYCIECIVCSSETLNNILLFSHFQQKKKSNFLKQSTQFLKQYYIKLIFQTRSLLNTTVHVVDDDT